MLTNRLALAFFCVFAISVAALKTGIPHLGVLGEVRDFVSGDPAPD